MSLSDAQGDLNIEYYYDSIGEDVSNAECCNTLEDFVANLESAIETATAIIETLRDLIEIAKEPDPDES